MFKFNQHELDWIKKQFTEHMKIYNGESTEDIRALVGDITGNSLDTVIMFHRKDWYLFSETIINNNKYENEKIIEYLWSVMWYWKEHEFETAEEVFKYEKDMEYCNLYERLYEYSHNED